MVDHDEGLEPGIIWDVAVLPVDDYAFDVCSHLHTLEHLPRKDLSPRPELAGWLERWF